MKMQIRAFGSLMGVSVRTLQYYDEIGLLCPAGQDAQNGYRYYDEASLKKMEKILFYRRMGFSLKRIFGIMNASEDERKALLEQQKKRLQAQRAHIDRMIGHIEQAQKEENFLQREYREE